MFLLSQELMKGRSVGANWCRDQLLGLDRLKGLLEIEEEGGGRGRGAADEGLIQLVLVPARSGQLFAVFFIPNSRDMCFPSSNQVHGPENTGTLSPPNTSRYPE